MTKYYIFRHGQTRNSKYHLPYSKDNRKIKILKDSIPAIKKMTEYLKNITPDLAASSEYLRCQQTTKIVAKITAMKFGKDSRLNEFGNETFLQFKKRIKDFLEEVEKNKYQTVVICTHGAVIAALKNLLIKGRIKKGTSFFIQNRGYYCIGGKKVKKFDFNKS